MHRRLPLNSALVSNNLRRLKMTALCERVISATDGAVILTPGKFNDTLDDLLVTTDVCQHKDDL